MKMSERSGQQCVAINADGQRCRRKALNGLDAPLCGGHAPGHRRGSQGRLQHGYYAKDKSPLEYLRRVRPEDYVRGGGLALTEENPIGIREREMDLHPPQPEQADLDLAIAELLHKMEILDALIFRAKEHDLDIVRLLELYLPATTRLGKLIGERHALASNETDDLMALLQRANELLDKEQDQSPARAGSGKPLDSTGAEHRVG
jgi:hypothetical protein